jgi:hypothetical protein
MVTTYAVDDGIDHRPTATQRAAARRVLAILYPTNAGDGR